MLKIKIKTQSLGTEFIPILRQKSNGTPSQVQLIGATVWGLEVKNIFTTGAQIIRFCPTDGLIVCLKQCALVFI
jgi:hypothetical protein